MAVAAAAVLVLLPACAAVMYEGAIRPTEQVVIIVPERTRLERVDAVEAPDASRFLIRAGLHAVVVSLDDEPAPGTVGRRYSTKPLAACFDAVAGHTYRLKPLYRDSAWIPVVFDEQTGHMIDAELGAGEHPNCYAGARAGAQAGTIDDSSSAEAAVPAPVSLVRESESAEPARAAETTRSRASIQLESGISFGGEELATVTFTNGETRTLGAGDGAIIAVGVGWTPLWLGNKVGLGGDLAFGIKYQKVGASNGGISLMRFPAIAAAHALVAFDQYWSLQCRLGLEKDVGGEISGSGFASSLPTLRPSSSVGLLAEIGPYYSGANHAGMAAALRVVAIDYALGPATVSANSVALVVSGHYDAWTQ